MTKKIIVVGGGPGGYSAALYCANLGMDVTLIEKKHLGGTCLNVGCIPTKVFVQASNVYAQLKMSAIYGINISGEVELDFSKTSKFKNKVTKQLRGGISFLLKNAGVKVIEGIGRMLDKNTVEVTSGDQLEHLKADEIILATGSSEIIIPGLEPDGVRVLNSTQMLDIKRLPESIAIIGGGVIGVEFASVFRRFGKEVTIIELSNSLIPTEDEQISKSLRESLEGQGIKIMTNTQAQGIERKTEESVTLKLKSAAGEDMSLTVEQILVCVGRRANLEGIGLENAGVKFNSRYIETNEKMQTNIENIYAVGDITASPQLAHVAYHEAKVAALTIVGKEASVDYHAIPSCIFSHPEVSRVGMTEMEARSKLKKVGVHIETFLGNGKAIIEGEAEGLVKMIFDQDTGTVVGFSIIGPKATELIAEPTLAVNLNMPITELAKNINAHPSLSEMIGEVAGAAVGLHLHSV